jgi:hypothetical protein
MQTMVRESWTDERLDDLNGRVGEGFVRMDAEFKRVDQRFDAVDARLDRFDVRFERLENNFHALQRTMLQLGFGLIGTLVVASGGLIATQI